jgi:hypothetical protein
VHGKHRNVLPGSAFCLRKHKYLDPVLTDKMHKMRPVEDISQSGWRVAEKAAAVAWSFLITNHDGDHFALTNISKFVAVAMARQRDMREVFGVNMGVLEVTTDIADYFVVMLWERVLNGCKRILDAAAKRRVRYVAVENIRKGKRRVHFGMSASRCFINLSLEMLLRYMEYGLYVSCVQVYVGVLARHANGRSIPMGGYMASAAAIAGGIDMEECFNCNPRRDALLLSGDIILKGIRVQDDTKLLFGFDATKLSVEEVVAVFHRSVAPLLYPKPFEITIDTRNSYLETQSMQVKGFIWYKWLHKNESALTTGKVVYKCNAHVGSYGAKQMKIATVVGHMSRIRSTCVLEADGIFSCICKLEEIAMEGSEWRVRDIKAILARQLVRNDDSFWKNLCKVYNLIKRR